MHGDCIVFVIEFLKLLAMMLRSKALMTDKRFLPKNYSLRFSLFHLIEIVRESKILVWSEYCSFPK